jgi:pimeloyl-ACP methyl ester carboxylesterase
LSQGESLFIPWPPHESSGVGIVAAASSTRADPNPERLHVRHVFPLTERLGAPVLMLHGAIENGRIFYSGSGKGLAPFMAQHGFDVYVPDLRGRGRSEPHISRHSSYGQLEAITEELPAFIDLIRSRRGDEPQVWMAHSWGGVLMLALLARRPEYRRLVRGIVFFGTKRTVHVRNWQVLTHIDFFWHRAAPALIALHGYLPARAYRAGSDDETRLSHAESMAWVKPGLWVDPRDGFDYGKALPTAELPPLLFLAGAGDRCLGNPQDVRALIRELGPQEVEFRVLGRRTGSRHDYGHIDMLTHPDAREDHFLDVLKWVRTETEALTRLY